MAISAKMVKEILDTLPTSYYLGNVCKVVFDENAVTSYCNPMSGEIHVALNNVVQALSGCEDIDKAEEFTRGALYHELSHLLLTGDGYRITDQFNIMEDERIESILKNYYMKVNFRKFIFAVSKWTPDWKPQKAMDFFFGICRYRKGPEHFLAEVNRLIKKWKCLNAVSSNSLKSEYQYDVENFWNEVQKYWNQNKDEIQNQQNQQDQNQQNQQNQQNESNQSDSQNSQGQNGESGDDQEQNNGQNGESSDDQEQNNGQNGDGQNDDNDSGSEDDEQNGEGQDGGNDEQNDENQSGSGNDQNQNDKSDNQDNGEQNGQSGNEQPNDDQNGDEDGENDSGNSDNGEENQNNESNGSQNGDSNDSENSDESNENSSKNSKNSQSDSSSNSDNGGNDDSTVEGDGEEEENDELSKAVKAAQDQTDDYEFTRKDAESILDKIFKKYSNSVIKEAIERIIIKATKKHSNRSPFSNAYSGRVDPRSVAFRNDCRWFIRKGDSGTSQFDRIHVTLWVDNSGSFCHAIHNINCLMFTLNELASKLPQDFCFDVITMNRANVKHDRFTAIEAYGSNCFGPNIDKLANQCKKPGWTNYNIAVWDGDMASGYGYTTAEYMVSNYKAAFRVFDNNHSIIVSDTSNSEYLNAGCPNAYKKYIDGNYSENFVTAVIELLERAI